MLQNNKKLLISEDIFNRLMEVSEINSLKELSNKYGYKDNWATSTRKREGIPYEACVLVSRKFNVSMDYLLFGDKDKLEEKILLNNNFINMLESSIADGLFNSIRKDVLTINDDAELSDATIILIAEITKKFKGVNKVGL